MCTVSFIPRGSGYVLAMNRDELLSRGAAHPPRRMQVSGVSAIAPTELNTSGTWIAANDHGITLALLNRNGKQDDHAAYRSRGEIIRQLIECTNSLEYRKRIEQLAVNQFRSFLLIGVFPAERVIFESPWQIELRLQNLSWERRHWFSSGLSDDRATLIRSGICDLHALTPDDELPARLRDLHAQHHSDSAFGICVHRPDAATVRYTEIAWDSDQLTMHYKDGYPCGSSPLQEHVVMKLSTAP